MLCEAIKKGINFIDVEILCVIISFVKVMAVWIVGVLDWISKWIKGNLFKVNFFMIHFKYLDKKDKNYLTLFDQIESLRSLTFTSQTLESSSSAFSNLGLLSRIINLLQTPLANFFSPSDFLDLSKRPLRFSIVSLEKSSFISMPVVHNFRTLYKNKIF